MLRLITDGKISPEEAVRAYHGVLQGKGLRPHRELNQDLELTDQSMSYDGSAKRRSTADVRNNPLAKPAGNGSEHAAKDGRSTWPVLSDGSPDFSKMNSTDRQAYDAWRLKRMFG
jgi:hypothetical protein